MDKVFTNTPLDKYLCSEGQLEVASLSLAKKYGRKFVYEERGVEMVCWLWEGRWYLG